jgi:hypothetical protein
MPTIFPTTPDMSDTMPYHWRMYMLIRHNRNSGYHFFDAATMRCFHSRVQTIPPYGGRVFVSSEKMSWNGPRFYTVRCISPAGGIDTLNRFSTRYNAHSFAKWYAAKNFVRVGNESIRLSQEVETA